MRISSHARFLALIVVLSVAAGCGKKDDGKGTKAAGKGAEKAATQVAAKVNSDEITVHQINSGLARTPNIPPDQVEAAKIEILNRLVDQSVAKQQAIEQKLDRSPNVLQSIEAARSEILARAYMEQFTSKQPKPGDDEVKKYYTENPALFSERRFYNLEEITVQPTEGLAAKLQEQIKKSRSTQEVANWLKSQEAKFSVNRGTRAAEALPLDLLPAIHSMKDGDIKMVDARGRLYVFRLIASKSEPVTEAQATPRIQQFLFNRRAGEALAAEMKRLKDKSKIEYVGEFSGGLEAVQKRAKEAADQKAKADAEAKTKAAAEAQARADIKAKAAAEAEARAEALSKARAAAEAQSKAEAEAKAKASASKGVSQDAIDKGLRGLK